MLKYSSILLLFLILFNGEENICAIVPGGPLWKSRSVVIEMVFNVFLSLFLHLTAILKQGIIRNICVKS